MKRLNCKDIFTIPKNFNFKCYYIISGQLIILFGNKRNTYIITFYTSSLEKESPHFHIILNTNINFDKPNLSLLKKQRTIQYFFLSDEFTKQASIKEKTFARQIVKELKNWISLNKDVLEKIYRSYGTNSFV